MKAHGPSCKQPCGGRRNEPGPRNRQQTKDSRVCLDKPQIPKKMVAGLRHYRRCSAQRAAPVQSLVSKPRNRAKTKKLPNQFSTRSPMIIAARMQLSVLLKMIVDPAGSMQSGGYIRQGNHQIKGGERVPENLPTAFLLNPACAALNELYY